MSDKDKLYYMPKGCTIPSFEMRGISCLQFIRFHANAARIKIQPASCEQVKPNKYSSGRKFVRSRVNVVLMT